MANDAHHVLPNPDGGWDVKREDAKRASHHTETKEEAVKIAKEIAMNQKTELIIHKLDGTIGERNSYGNDPYPPKG
ncbi:DUF2188 domain-containing protein [Proteiniclasticum sp.]|uniref:DUF2188 domain-containing protein n=1 Tax=Proteiniclasticum sp. TaxID=2053595 RepID=UPI0028964581|nr:DUF2188 domain-containing protein [Proteiniclasticum sp.]